jgi:hypothetical protein
LLGAEGVSFFIKVFRETGCVAVVSEGFLLFLVKKSSFDITSNVWMEGGDS